MTFDHDLKATVRTIPDYPKPGILFRDITTLLGEARAFRRAVDELVHPWAGSKIDKVAGIEARGFILGGAVAHQLSVGFIPVRKKGKLPWQVLSEDYALEYGIDRVEIHTDAVVKGDHIVLIDDLIATGGTCFAAIKLLERAGGRVVGCSFVDVVVSPGWGGSARPTGTSCVSSTFLILASTSGSRARIWSFDSPCLPQLQISLRIAWSSRSPSSVKWTGPFVWITNW